MFCLPGLEICLSKGEATVYFLLFLVLSVGGICFLWLLSRRRQKEEEYEKEEEDEEQRPLRVDQKVLYDTSNGLNCYLIITDVDNNKINGFFTVEIPPDAQVLSLHFDREEGEICISFNQPGKGATELVFDTIDPEEVDGYDIYIDYVNTVFPPTNPV